MTLVLTVATSAFVVQAADRLLTKKYVTIRTHDPIANKTILYRAEDAVAAISYSGLAYREGKPTDEWFAELLWGGPIPRGEDGAAPPIFRVDVRPNRWTINQAIQALRAAIDAIPQAELDLGGMELALTGWRNDGQVGRPFVIEMRRHPKAAAATVTGTRMRWPHKQDPVPGRIGAWMPRGALNAAFEPARAAGALSAVDAERILVDLIRKESARQPTVGPNVISLILPKPGTGPILSRFHPAVPHQADAAADGAAHQVEVAHTPWALWSMGFHPPMALAGSMMGDLDGNAPFVFEGTALTSGPILGVSSAIARRGP